MLFNVCLYPSKHEVVKLAGLVELEGLGLCFAPTWSEIQFLRVGE